MFKLVLVRHGESTWNQENRFTGWTDVDLSAKGREEARVAGIALRDAGFCFDIVYTSLLKRAIHTERIICEAMGIPWVQVIKDWRLNERHYGALQGLNKTEIAVHYGEEQVQLWRRSFDVRPPPLNSSDPRHPIFDLRYSRLDRHCLPATESLKDTMKRSLQVWDEGIFPNLSLGNQVLVAAHGNTLRALVKYLEHIPDAEIAEVNIPTGCPLVYEFDDAMEVMAHYYLNEKPSDRLNDLKNQNMGTILVS